MQKITESWTIWNAVVFQALLLTFQVTLYFGCEKFQKNFHNVLRPVDAKIPFQPGWVYIYVLWFPLIAVFPLSLFLFRRSLYLLYILSIITDILLSVCFYMIYPTTFDRPQPPQTLTGRAMKLVYKSSYRGVNCMPSLHCSQCFLIIAAALLCTELPFWQKCGYIALSAGIIYSTVATKQHALIDMITALPTAAVSMLIGWGLYRL